MRACFAGSLDSGMTRMKAITKSPVIAIDLPTPAILVSGAIPLSASRIEKKLRRLFIVAKSRRQRYVDIAIVSRGFHRSILRIECRNVEYYRLISQVKHSDLIKGVIIRPSNGVHFGVGEFGRLVNLIPAIGTQGVMRIHSCLVIHIIHGDILVRSPYNIFDLRMVELHLCVRGLRTFWHRHDCGDCSEWERSEGSRVSSTFRHPFQPRVCSGEAYPRNFRFEGSASSLPCVSIYAGLPREDNCP